MKVGYTLDSDKSNTKIPNTPIITSIKSDAKMSVEKYAVFHIEGGLGKNIAGTAIVNLIKQVHSDRKLVVVASYPEIFLNNPNVYRVYRVGNTSYFYDDYINNKDTIVFKHEPYFQTNHILKKKSLIENWAELFGLPYKASVMPELYMNGIQLNTVSRWVRNKPIMVLHTNGGPLHHQKYNYAWTRDMPYSVSSAIVDKYKNDYHIIQICRNETQALPNVEVVVEEMSAMELFSLLRMSQKRVLIDSSLQHAAAALKLPSTVLWVGTSPTVFGYNIHSNITATPPTDQVKLIDSYLFDYQFTGELHECPYMDMDTLFNLNSVFKQIDII